MRYVIAYDVVASKRRQRVAEYLLGHGRRVQKSVYECELSAAELARVRQQLDRLLQAPPDRCHVYRLCADCAAGSRVYGGDLEHAWDRVIVV
jgi:CRISPR-associated protein Cas2